MPGTSPETLLSKLPPEAESSLRPTYKIRHLFNPVPELAMRAVFFLKNPLLTATVVVVHPPHASRSLAPLPLGPERPLLLPTLRFSRGTRRELFSFLWAQPSTREGGVLRSKGHEPPYRSSLNGRGDNAPGFNLSNIADAHRILFP